MKDKIMFSALSWLYSKIIDQRNLRYEDGTFKSHALSVPVISVGNITVGGTGKTPLVGLIAEILAESGEKVCVISRGYKRANPKQRVLVSDGNEVLADVQNSGDEPFELACALLGKSIVIADADRIAAGKWAIEKFKVTRIVLDDAFQHRKISRDLNIVTVDATNPFGNEMTLPSGILREPIENLERADLFVITRSNLANDPASVEERIRAFNGSAPVIWCENRISKVTDLAEMSSGTNSAPESLKDRSLFGFCAIGNPNSFFQQLKMDGFNLAETKSFSDHHSYNQRDVDMLGERAKQKNCDAFITTVKDAVKLDQLEFRKPCYVAKSELIIKQKNKLHELINAVSTS
ncbi:MAG: tetraacyldisaccharide 4'-kinase [Pyrinomonadaceae bacterium]|nr:tetraacyldisaccharide 4'-kinase [Pyrinomonadaceae bacterium]